jgi:small GTP-binding protein
MRPNFLALLNGCTRRLFVPSANFQSFSLSSASKSAIGHELFDRIMIRDGLLILSMTEDPVSIKVIVVGESGGGKTALLNRMVNETFSKQSGRPTVGAEFHTLVLADAARQYRLHLWDTAGQERFRAIAVSFFRKAQIALLCFAIDRRDMLNALSMWRHEVCECADPAFVVVATKTDLADGAAQPVTAAEVREKLPSLGFDPDETPIVETSSLTGDGFPDLNDILLQIASGIAHPRQKAVTIEKEVERRSGCCMSHRE